MTHKRRAAIILALIAILAIVAGIAYLSHVSRLRILGSSPGDGTSEVPITTNLRIVFSQPMDKASVESRLHIEPETPGRFLWEGSEVVFEPQGGLAPGTHYSARLEEGAVSESGHQLGSGLEWIFQTRTPQLLYLGRTSPEGDERQLYASSLDGSPPRQITQHSQGVWDYAVHPQGESIVYSGLRADGGADFWILGRDGSNRRLLLACPESACVGAAWAPDGRQIAYERRDIWASAPNLDPKAGRIWLLDVEGGQERPLLDYDVPLHSPVWAPGGGRLAFVSPLLPGVEVYDIDTGELWQFSNQWGEAPVWSQDGDHLLMPDLLLDGESLAVRLVSVDIGRSQAVDISGEDRFVKDTSPAWSPLGGWIAFGRTYQDEERWTPGRQIWLTRPDGSEAYVLLAEPMSDLFGLAWRPDAAALAYLRVDLSEEAQAVPHVSVWVFDLIDRAPFLVADQGVLAAWLP
jgi:Tol biopolymer transport system component